MKKALSIICLCILLFGCSFGTGVNASLTKVGYILRNTPEDWWNASSTVKPALTYTFTLIFSGNLVESDIVSARVYLPNSTSYWSLDPEGFDESTGRLRGYGFYYGSNNKEMPVGDLRAKVVLSDGKILEYNFTMGIPGYKSNSGKDYVFSIDDQATATYPSVSVPALRRPSITSDSISSEGIIINFIVNDSYVNNGWINFYDEDENYIGCTKYFRSTSTGVGLSCLNNGAGFNHDFGESNVIVLSSNGIFDDTGNEITESNFSKISSYRLVVIDGSQYEISGTYSNYDYISYSELNNL